MSASFAARGPAMLPPKFTRESRQPRGLSVKSSHGLLPGVLLAALAAADVLSAAPPEQSGGVTKSLPSADPAAIAFFEKKIRPVLVAKCLECHGDDPEDLAGGLSLASAAGWKRGGDSGPAIEPGSAEASRLIAALEYDGVEMPPDGKLSRQTIDDFRRWIDDGAVDPRRADAPVPQHAGETVKIDESRDFWAFQPPQRSDPPTVENDAWCRDPLDRFVLARLEQAELTPSPDASPETLLRRICYDLTGLPPSPDLLDAFLRNPSEEHYEEIVDRLLQSPEHAEHWARHWLDVARYADSNGSDFNATFHHAWRYRDYVIRSFAQDKPFDQFVCEQIAGDLMQSDDRQQRSDQIVATGFLMLGAKMLSERNKNKLTMDVVDEQIDTVGRAFLGLTVGCARCHDHKFDPIPTTDYYALAGIFQNTITLEGESQKYVSTWVDVPLPADPDHVARVQAHEQKESALAAELKQAEAALKKLQTKPASELPGVVLDDSVAEQIGSWVASTYSKPFIEDGYLHDGDTNKGDCSLIFRTRLPPGRYELRLAFAGSPNRASKIPVRVVHAEGTSLVHLDQSRPGEIDGRWQAFGTFRFGGDAEAVVTISNEGTSGFVLADALHFFPVETDVAEATDTEMEKQRAAEKEAAAQALAEAERVVEQAKRRLTRHREQAPDPLPVAMAVRDSGKGEDAHVCIRGEVDNRGEKVARGFIRVCGEHEGQLPPDQSGRLQLAQWITDPDHPLTGRVIVNRIWMHLMGEGIVRTVDNFGHLGDRPSHPELLDTLAVDFVQDRWSVRRLIRRIVTSRTYRQASTYRDDAFANDPKNRLWWRAHRRRLPAEAMRDTLLVAAGRLDRTPTVQPMAGYGTLVSKNVANPKSVSVGATDRRSLYIPIIRGKVPPLLAVFDLANPSMLVGKRPETNVPAQALVMLNHPRIVELAEQIADRSATVCDERDERLGWLYKSCLQRAPDEVDREMVNAFLAETADEAAGWRAVTQMLIASTEFRFLD